MPCSLEAEKFTPDSSGPFMLVSKVDFYVVKKGDFSGQWVFTLCCWSSSCSG
jgi:hypothetical protein